MGINADQTVIFNRRRTFFGDTFRLEEHTVDNLVSEHIREVAYRLSTRLLVPKQCALLLPLPQRRLQVIRTKYGLVPYEVHESLISEIVMRSDIATGTLQFYDGEKEATS